MSRLDNGHSEGEISEKRVRAIAAEILLGKMGIESDDISNEMRRRLRALFAQCADSIGLFMTAENRKAEKCGISLEQWEDVSHIMGLMGIGEEGADNIFEFPGGGRIIRKGDLDFSEKPGLRRLPEGLSVEGNLFLHNCKGISNLSEGLSVGGDCKVSHCTGLSCLSGNLSVNGTLWLTQDIDDAVKKDAQRLHEEGKIRQVLYEPPLF